MTTTSPVEELLEHAGELLAAGAPRDEAAAKLAAEAGSRKVLEEAYREATWRVHLQGSSDQGALAVARLLLTALRQLPVEAPVTAKI